MKTILKHSSLLLTVGLMVAPLGASAQDEPATVNDAPMVEAEAAQAEVVMEAGAEKAVATTEAEVVQAEVVLEAKAEEAVAITQAEIAVAETEAAVASRNLSEANSMTLAEARKMKNRTIRAKLAKNQRDWVRFAFEKDADLESRKFDLWKSPSRAERVKNRRQWLEFAFDIAE